MKILKVDKDMAQVELSKEDIANIYLARNERGQTSDQDATTKEWRSLIEQMGGTFDDMGCLSWTWDGTL